MARRKGLTMNSSEALRLARWLLGEHTGVSSKTIAAVMLGLKIGWPGEPADPGDFGRCHSLLLEFPEWRARLGEVAARYPRWKGLVANWGELERMYEGVMSGTVKWLTMSERMDELRRVG